MNDQAMASNNTLAVNESTTVGSVIPQLNMFMVFIGTESKAAFLLVILCFLCIFLCICSGSSDSKENEIPGWKEENRKNSDLEGQITSVPASRNPGDLDGMINALPERCIEIANRPFQKTRTSFRYLQRYLLSFDMPTIKETEEEYDTSSDEDTKYPMSKAFTKWNDAISLTNEERDDEEETLV